MILVLGAFNDRATGAPLAAALAQRFTVLSYDRRGRGDSGDAVEYFQLRMVGIPEAVVAQLRHAPFRPALEAMAHTLVYEATLMGDGRLTPLNVRQPTLAIAGAASFPFMRETAEALARALPHGRALTLEGATHDIVPAVLGPVLERFFG